MMQKILDFFSSPLNISYFTFILLGFIMILFSIVGRSIDKRKTVLTRLSGKEERVGFIDSLLDKSKFVQKHEEEFSKKIAVLDMDYNARTFTKIKLGSALVGIIVSIYLRNIYVVIPLVIICVNIPTTFLEMRVRKRIALFNDQVLEAFQIFITEYTTTRSVQKTIVDICPKLKNPLRKEFERLGRKLNSGEPIEESFLEFAERTQNKWTLIFSQMMITYFRNGGDFTEQLLNITKNITDEKILEEANTTELSSMRLINIAMNALVPVVYVSNRFINPEDAKVFVETPVGRFIMFGVVIACSISLYLGKKITEA